MNIEDFELPENLEEELKAKREAQLLEDEKPLEEETECEACKL